jgi:hypothetical protein
VTTAFALPGNSGSPILDAQGRLVGIDHRGPASIDLVAAHSVADYSVGTASAPLLAALEAPLPATMRSVTDPVTREQVVALHRLYLGAHVADAMVDGKPTSVFSILAGACDEALAKGVWRSPEEFTDVMSPCSQAHEWFACQPSETPQPWKVCPTDKSKADWTARFEALFAARRALNGELLPTLITTYLAELEPTEGAGIEAAASHLRALDAERPPVDFSLAYYYAAWNVDTLGGKSIADIIKNYARRPHYELEATAIMNAATWLAHYGRMTPDELVSLLRALSADDAIPLGAKLSIDEYRWLIGR